MKGMAKKAMMGIKKNEGEHQAQILRRVKNLMAIPQVKHNSRFTQYCGFPWLGKRQRKT